MEEKTRYFKVSSVALLIFFVVYKIYVGLDKTYVDAAGNSLFYIWNELPFQPCHVILWLSVISIYTNWEPGKAFSAMFGLFCPLMALLFPPQGFYGVSLFLPRCIGFWFFHAGIITQSVNMLILGIYKPTFKKILLPGAVFFGIMIPLEVLNIILSKTVLPDASYFYTRGFLSGSNYPLDLLRSWIPVDVIYMIPALIGALIPFSIITLLANIKKPSEPESNQE